MEWGSVSTCSQKVGDKDRRSWTVDLVEFQKMQRSFSPKQQDVANLDWNPVNNLCWFPLVIVTDSQGHSPTASPSLTAMYLMDRHPVISNGFGSHGEDVLVSQVFKEISKATVNMNQYAYYQISTYASAFNILHSSEDLHIQRAPTKGATQFDSWVREVKNKMRNYQGMGTNGYELKICMVCPIMCTGEDSNMYPYAPFETRLKAAWEIRIGGRIPIGADQTFPIDPRGLQFVPWSQPRPKSHRDLVQGWTQGLLFDSSIRTSTGNVSLLSKRMNTYAIQIPSLDEMFDHDSYVADDNLAMANQPPSPIFFGSAITDRPGDMCFPNMNSLIQYMEIHTDQNANEGGIPDPSNSAESEDESMQSPLFIETWKDTRGIILVDLCERSTCYYHEFIRCKTCNGEVEIRSPRDHIPPETECPHCLTAGSISWEYRLNDESLTGSGLNG